MRRRLKTSLILVMLLPLLAGAEVPVARQTQLRNLLLQDCGSCHGMTMKGGLGPSLLPGALEEKPDQLLVNTILHGRPGTAMPPWDFEISREEAAWLIKLLREGVDNAH